VSIESNLSDWWNSSGEVTGIVTGGLWRDEVPEKNASDVAIEMPFARFAVIAESPTAIQTKTEGESREYLEEQLIQLDIFAKDPATAKRSRDAARDLLDKWNPTLEPPDIFIGIDRTNSLLLKETDEQDGENVWHAVLEYVVTVQRESHG
jgi:hypothetical protein